MFTYSNYHSGLYSTPDKCGTCQHFNETVKDCYLDDVSGVCELTKANRFYADWCNKFKEDERGWQPETELVINEMMKDAKTRYEDNSHEYKETELPSD